MAGNIVLATAVGESPCGARTNSSSPHASRSRARAWLVADWLSASRSAARLTLPRSCTASNTVSRLRSSLRRLNMARLPISRLRLDPTAERTSLEAADMLRGVPSCQRAYACHRYSQCKAMINRCKHFRVFCVRRTPMVRIWTSWNHDRNWAMSETANSGHGTTGSGPRRYSRRLSDKILTAFHQACDQSDYEIAQHLLHILETLIDRSTSHSSGNRRRNMETLVAANERLWHLRHRGRSGG
jgi:hypothetical protein